MSEERTIPLEELIADYKANERDIAMCQLAVEGRWSNVSYPAGILSECLEMRPKIKKLIIEAGGSIPQNQIEQLLAKIDNLQSLADHLADALEQQRRKDACFCEAEDYDRLAYVYGEERTGHSDYCKAAQEALDAYKALRDEENEPLLSLWLA